MAKIMQLIALHDPGEKKFHQAVEEVIDTVQPGPGQESALSKAGQP